MCIRKALLVKLILCACVLAAGLPAQAAARKIHAVSLGAAKKVGYSRAGDPAGALPGEDSLRVRPLVVDGAVKEWTTGEAHDVTDRSFVVRRALRLNDVLPGEKPSSPGAQSHWVWQRGPWLLVDRVSGHVSPIKLADYDPGVSHVSWFRDYAAYCGLTPSGKSLYAIVSQISARRPSLSKKLGPFKGSTGGDEATANPPQPVCGEPEWQRDPLRITFHPTGRDAATFEFVPGSALLVEDAADEPETPAKSE